MRMKEKRVTVAERLELLLPWLNGDVDDPGKALGVFLGEYVAAGREPPGGPTEILGNPGGDLTRRQLDELRGELLQLLETTEPGADLDPWHSLSSLEFAWTRQWERPARLPKAVAERRAVEGPGAFSLSVFGDLPDVVLYAFGRTLTEAGAVHLSRCPAPAPRDWSSTCGRWFVKGGRRGPAARYCSERCRVRAWRVKDSDYGGSKHG